MYDVNEPEVRDVVVSVHVSCLLLYSLSTHHRCQDVSSCMLRRLVSISEIVVVVVVMSLSIEVEDVQCPVVRRTVVPELLQHIDV